MEQQNNREELKESTLKEQLTDKEQKVISLMRKIKFGEIRIVIQDGIPFRVEEIRHSIKL
ncbi:MAG: DUF2292 domain-containing protein [Oscillospiraceae bacterium]|nr:DUF2292 domain-containing protein [Oscillospiraceae bacterium]